MNLLDIGGGFPAPYDDTRQAVPRAGQDHQPRARPAVSRRTSRSSPSRAGSWCATAATAVSKIIGKAVRDGKLCYYIDDGVYHTFSGVIFDHCQYHLKAFKRGPTQICSVFGPTCDALDMVSHGGGTARDLRAGRPALQRTNRRLQPRLLDLVQRLPARQGGAREPVNSAIRRCACALCFARAVRAFAPCKIRKDELFVAV